MTNGSDTENRDYPLFIDPEPGNDGPEINTRVSFLYRDAAN